MAKTKKRAQKQEVAALPTKKEVLEQFIAETALKVADIKELLALRRLNYEEYNQRAHHNLERVKTLHVAALSIEDPKERSRTLRETETLEKDVRDNLFKIAEGRSVVRRYTKEMEKYEKQIIRCKELLRQHHE